MPQNIGDWDIWGDGLAPLGRNLGNLIERNLATTLKITLGVVLGIGLGFASKYDYFTKEVNTPLAPIEKTLDNNRYAIVRQEDGRAYRFSERKGEFVDLETLRREELNKQKVDYQTRIDKINAKYEDIQRTANSVKAE